MTIVERIARVLTGQHYSRTAHRGGPDDMAVADLVDMHWKAHVDDAMAVLKTLREADPEMCAAGNAVSGGAAATWEAMVRAAIGEAE